MSEQASKRIPDVTMKAYGHGRELRLAALGVPAMYTCVARETADQPAPVARAVREAYPSAEQVLVMSVADLRKIPKLLKPIVDQLMKSNYKNAVDNLQPGRTAEDHVLILPDYDGEFLGPLGIADLTKQIAVVVADAAGNVAGVYQGDEPAEAALKMMGAVMDAASVG
jgi:hypothetical protein